MKKSRNNIKGENANLPNAHEVSFQEKELLKRRGQEYFTLVLTREVDRILRLGGAKKKIFEARLFSPEFRRNIFEARLFSPEV